MKAKLNTQKGITLVALVITIIIMLILAGVTVKIATSGGLIEETQNATNQFTEEQEKEKVREGYLAYKNLKMVDDDATLTVEDASSVTGNATKGWVVTFESENENRMYKITKDGKVSNYDPENEPLADDWYDFTEEESKIITYSNNAPGYRIADSSPTNRNSVAILSTDGGSTKELLKITVSNKGYWFALSDSGKNLIESGAGQTIEKYKWYISDDEGNFVNFRICTDSNPISISDFSECTIYSESYLNRIIKSFSKQNS